MDLVRQGNQDDWELARRRAELARLEQETADREGALDAYMAELAAFERRYYAAFAATFAELDELDAQIAEKAAALRPEDGSKRRKAERLRARANGQAEAPPQPASEPERPDDELKSVYRSLSKLIHPDLAAEPGERAHREALMIQANVAYAAGDKDQLAFLLSGRTLESGDPDDAWTRVMRQIDRASGRLAQAAARRAAAEETELARLMRRALKAERDGRDLFAKIAGELEEEKRAARKRLKALDRRLAKAKS